MILCYQINQLAQLRWLLKGFEIEIDFLMIGHDALSILFLHEINGINESNLKAHNFHEYIETCISH